MYNDFYNFYELIRGLHDSSDAREGNLLRLKKRKKKLELNTTAEGMAELQIVLIAIGIFKEEIRYREWREKYAKYKIKESIEWSLYGDKAVSVKEFEKLIKDGMELGLTEADVRKYVKAKVTEQNWIFLNEPESEESHRSSAVGDLTPMASANVASGIAASLAFVYLLLFSGGFNLGGWFGFLLLVPISTALVSVKNANEGAKRHGWGLVTVAILYFVNYNMFLILLPVFAIWHWSPFIFSRFQSKSNLVWLLPLILCVGVYGSVEAVQRIPRRQSNHVPPTGIPGSVKRQPQTTVAPAEKPNQRTTTQESPVTTKVAKPQERTLPSGQNSKDIPRKDESLKEMEMTTEYIYSYDSLDFKLFAISGPSNTDINLSVGDTLIINVLDEKIVQWSENESSVGPGGASFRASSLPDGLKFLCADAPCGSVVGRIGNDGKWFVVGVSSVIVVPNDGMLYLSINDFEDGFDDNFGMFMVQIQHAMRQPSRN